jgi:hypothetical protein
MTSGLRYFALLPGLVAFAMAAATMAWPKQEVGQILDFCLATVAVLIAILWWVAHRWTRSPLERRYAWQGPRNRTRSGAEGPDPEGEPPDPSSAERYLEEAQAEIEQKCGPDDPLWVAYEVRCALRRASEKIPDDLREEYLIQRYPGLSILRPPSVFIDSGEVAPTFIGLRQIQKDTLEMAARDDDDEGVRLPVGA